MDTKRRSKSGKSRSNSRQDERQLPPLHRGNGEYILSNKLYHEFDHRSSDRLKNGPLSDESWRRHNFEWNDQLIPSNRGRLPPLDDEFKYLEKVGHLDTFKERLIRRSLSEEAKTTIFNQPFILERSISESGHLTDLKQEKTTICEPYSKLKDKRLLSPIKRAIMERESLDGPVTSRRQLMRPNLFLETPIHGAIRGISAPRITPKDTTTPSTIASQNSSPKELLARLGHPDTPQSGIPSYLLRNHNLQLFDQIGDADIQRADMPRRDSQNEIVTRRRSSVFYDIISNGAAQRKNSGIIDAHDQLSDPLDHVSSLLQNKQVRNEHDPPWKHPIDVNQHRNGGFCISKIVSKEIHKNGEDKSPICEPSLLKRLSFDHIDKAYFQDHQYPQQLPSRIAAIHQNMNNDEFQKDRHAPIQRLLSLDNDRLQDTLTPVVTPTAFKRYDIISGANTPISVTPVHRTSIPFPPLHETEKSDDRDLLMPIPFEYNKTEIEPGGHLPQTHLESRSSSEGVDIDAVTVSVNDDTNNKAGDDGNSDTQKYYDTDSPKCSEIPYSDQSTELVTEIHRPTSKKSSRKAMVRSQSCDGRFGVSKPFHLGPWHPETPPHVLEMSLKNRSITCSKNNTETTSTHHIDGGCSSTSASADHSPVKQGRTVHPCVHAECLRPLQDQSAYDPELTHSFFSDSLWSQHHGTLGVPSCLSNDPRSNSAPPVVIKLPTCTKISRNSPLCEDHESIPACQIGTLSVGEDKCSLNHSMHKHLTQPESLPNHNLNSTHDKRNRPSPVSAPQDPVLKDDTVRSFTNLQIDTSPNGRDQSKRFETPPHAPGDQSQRLLNVGDTFLRLIISPSVPTIVLDSEPQQQRRVSAGSSQSDDSGVVLISSPNLKGTKLQTDSSPTTQSNTNTLSDHPPESNKNIDDEMDQQTPITHPVSCGKSGDQSVQNLLHAPSTITDSATDSCQQGEALCFTINIKKSDTVDNIIRCPGPHGKSTVGISCASDAGEELRTIVESKNCSNSAQNNPSLTERASCDDGAEHKEEPPALPETCPKKWTLADAIGTYVHIGQKCRADQVPGAPKEKMTQLDHNCSTLTHVEPCSNWENMAYSFDQEDMSPHQRKRERTKWIDDIFEKFEQHGHDQTIPPFCLNRSLSDQSEQLHYRNSIDGNPYQSQQKCDRRGRRMSINAILQRQKSDGSLHPSDLKCWQQGKLLGKGAYGEVYEVRIGTYFLAVKRIKLQDGSRRTDDTYIQKIIKEITTLQYLNHPRILSYRGFLLEESNNRVDCLIFTDIMAAGSLRILLQKFGRLYETMTKKITIQILEGLVYLHDKNMTHLDIKSGNILLDLKGNSKIADFGCVNERSIQASLSNTHIPSDQIRGSLYWMAPEVFRGTPGRRSDIWSTGCVVIEMYTAQIPWYDIIETYKLTTMMQTACFFRDTLERPPLPKQCSAAALEFFYKVLERNISKRPFARETLQLAFCQDGEIDTL